jgi:maltose alpha-D-glucosyltransferase / alpha-amylase
MQWSKGLNAGFSEAPSDSLFAPVIDTPPYTPAEVNVADQLEDSGSLLNFTCKLISIIKAHMAFGEGEFNWATCENTAIATYFRTYQNDDQNERILVVQNLSGDPQAALIYLPPQMPPGLVDLLTGAVFPVGPDGNLHVQLEPYTYYWLEV